MGFSCVHECVCVCVCVCVNCILHCGFFLDFTRNHQIYLVGYVLFSCCSIFIYSKWGGASLLKSILETQFETKHTLKPLPFYETSERLICISVQHLQVLQK